MLLEALWEEFEGISATWRVLLLAARIIEMHIGQQLELVR